MGPGASKGVERLSEDLTSSSMVNSGWIGESTVEAPAMFKRKGVYYLYVLYVLLHERGLLPVCTTTQKGGYYQVLLHARGFTMCGLPLQRCFARFLASVINHCLAYPAVLTHVHSLGVLPQVVRPALVLRAAGVGRGGVRNPMQSSNRIPRPCTHLQPPRLRRRARAQKGTLAPLHAEQ